MWPDETATGCSVDSPGAGLDPRPSFGAGSPPTASCGFRGFGPPWSQKRQPHLPSEGHNHTYCPLGVNGTKWKNVRATSNPPWAESSEHGTTGGQIKDRPLAGHERGCRCPGGWKAKGYGTVDEGVADGGQITAGRARPRSDGAGTAADEVRAKLRDRHSRSWQTQIIIGRIDGIRGDPRWRRADSGRGPGGLGGGG